MSNLKAAARELRLLIDQNSGEIPPRIQQMIEACRAACLKGHEDGGDNSRLLSEVINAMSHVVAALIVSECDHTECQANSVRYTLTTFAKSLAEIMGGHAEVRIFEVPRRPGSTH